MGIRNLAIRKEVLVEGNSKDLVSLSSLFKKFLENLNIPFVDTCCHGEYILPVQYSPDTGKLSYFDPSLKQWMPIDVGGGSGDALESLRIENGYVEGLKNGSWIQQYEIPVPETPEVGEPYNGISGGLSDGFKLGGDLDEDTYLNIQGGKSFNVGSNSGGNLTVSDNLIGLTIGSPNNGFFVFDNKINLGYYYSKRITFDNNDNYAFSVNCNVDGYTFPIESPLENQTLVADANRNLKWQNINKEKEYTVLLSNNGTTINATVLKNTTGVTFSWGAIDGYKLPFTASAGVGGSYVFMQNNIQRVQPGGTPTIFYLGDNPSAIFNGSSGELQTLDSSGVPSAITFSDVLVQFLFYE